MSEVTRLIFSPLQTKNHHPHRVEGGHTSLFPPWLKGGELRGEARTASPVLISPDSASVGPGTTGSATQTWFVEWLMAVPGL
jgi:hypothetical protein